MIQLRIVVSMTLISLVVLSTTNLSFGKEQESGYTKSCILYYTFDVWDPIIKDIERKRIE